VPAAILLEIGLAVTIAAQVEWLMRRLIGRVLGIEKSATIEIATAELSYRQLVSFLSSLVLGRVGKDDETHQDFDQCIRGLDRFEQYRNVLVHSYWHNTVEADKVVTHAIRNKTTAKRGAGLKASVTEVTREEIHHEVNRAMFWYTSVEQTIDRLMTSHRAA
jgi:hypothetical protein